MASSSTSEFKIIAGGNGQQNIPQGTQDKGTLAAKWTLADDEAMFDVLLYAKECSDVSQNGHFKIQTWQDVSDAVAVSTSVGGRKDVENCKSRLQRVRRSVSALYSM